ncbi:Sodium/hydrogen exchanger 4 [Linum perenne]
MVMVMEKLLLRLNETKMWENVSPEHAQVIPMTIFVAVLCLCFVVGHLLEENRWVNESITAIFIGFVTGILILVLRKGKSSHLLRFSEELFFIYLLPPIIFNAGFQVKKKHFFQNFVTIMLFGIIGVFISTVIISLAGGCFPSWDSSASLHGTISVNYLYHFIPLHFRFQFHPLLCLNDFIGFSYRNHIFIHRYSVHAADETPLLYSIVFGEGVVNDATSVVLFNAIQKMDVSKINSRTILGIIADFLYLFSTSTALGIAVGLLTAFVLKRLYFGKHSSIRELALMVLMAYLSYMLAELLELSGILTVFFCGIIMSHYSWHNVTESSRITARHVFSMMSFVAETFIFLYVGMDALDIEKWKMTKLSFGTSLEIYGSIVFLILLGRAVFVFPLSAFSNFMNRRKTSPLGLRHQVVIWWAGLMRGAVSIALAFKQFTYSGVTWDPINATMITNTIIVVLFTTLVFGFLTKPLVNYLITHQTRNRNNRGRGGEPTSPKDDAVLPLLSFEESASANMQIARESFSMLMDRPVYTIHHYWRRFDNAYMRPIFGGPRHVPLNC